MKQISFLLLTITVLAIVSESIYSQDIPVVSQGNFKFYFDTNSFKGRNDSTYQEFYLMFYTDQISTQNNFTRNLVNFKISSEIFDQYGELINSRNWTTVVELDTSLQNSNEKVAFDQWEEFLIPGNYEIIVSTSDSVDQLFGHIKAKFNVKSFNSHSLSISDPQFILKTDELNESSIFNKGGLTVYPNVWRRYGLLNPKLTFYYEVYGIDISHSKPLNVSYEIKTKDNIKLKSLSNIELNRTAMQRTVLHAIDINNLPSGVYTLSINVKDSINNSESYSDKTFEVFQLDNLDNNSILSAEEFELFDQLLRYIAEESEYNFYKKLDNSAKELFIINFWKSKDPIPETKENEFLFSIMERFNYANQKYSWGDQPGWKSDRGKVLIQYGMPDEIESHYSDPSTVPYEIWKFQLEKNYIFVFIDRNSNGRFTLTHSTMPGEISNPYWISLARE